ncbi:MAG: ATP synthase F1 subunit delta [bacterium]
MKENVLARRYARALFEIALEGGALDKIHTEVGAFYQALQSSDELRVIVHSQEIKRQEKQQTVAELLHKRASKLFLNFFLLLLKKNREILFETIAHEFDIIVDRHKKKIRASAITAIPLDSQALSSLKGLLDKTYSADVAIDNNTDPSILGGIIVKISGQVFDGSLESQLKRLKSKLSENTNSHVV